ncbi:Eukaryotic aspartyl protease family protein [Clavispora lusitaniae]|uniref:Peptidase A1 domain-containing protein n=1 Tax=Clavispora lusitaniae (strain ATCC 42720) TaxID=306902 RepID=C4YBF6_CLAL4|nr:uncharacterized protein CLUG_05534 [Clavispora lusitaniae ATCC 42720]EEQ41406.1 predicted protein [Clavispora lusitaniae ATCC 42720]KAF7581109.1 Eukaryotic aspartyl protease family protein [Clavispora lusitaniae]
MHAALFLYIVAAVAAQLGISASHESTLPTSTDDTYQGKFETGMSFGFPPEPINATLSVDNAYIDINLSIGDHTIFTPAIFENDSISDYGDVELGGFRLHNFSVGMAVFMEGSIVGLGLPRRADIISPLDAMKNAGQIKSRSFSFKISDDDEGVLFGAIDHGMYQQPLRKYKMFNDLADAKAARPPTILLDGMAGNNFSITSQTVVVISDYTSFNLDYYYGLLDHFNATLDFNDSFRPDPLISCSYMNSTEYISLYFSGDEYRVPEKNFISYARDDEGNITGCRLSGSWQEYHSMTLSKSLFLNDLYMVVDYDNEEIGLAPLASESNPETIEQLSTGVPSATEAEYFSYSTGWTTQRRLLSSALVYSYTIAHPTYPMYTGRRLKESATEPFNTATSSASSARSASSASSAITSSFASAPSEQTSTSDGKNSTKASSSKGSADKKTSGGLLLFLASFVALMMI